MFFSITPNIDNRFPNHVRIGVMHFNHDAGWITSATEFYKGYADNYCRIVVQDNHISLHHNHYRSFPLWYGEQILTNLPMPGLQSAWADESIIIDQGLIKVSKTQLDLTVSKYNLHIEQAKNDIIDILDQKAKNLKSIQDKPIKLFCSGGVDTSLLHAMFTYHEIEFELLLDGHFEYDDFTAHNIHAIQEFWAYVRIHHWIDPAWLASGSCGDEYFLRGPPVVAMLTAWHDIDFLDILEKNNTCYHYLYYKKFTDLFKQSWSQRYQLKKDYATIQDLQRQILNMLSNDHQHWHLGNTLTWTPYNDIQIAKTLLACDIKDLIPQFLDGHISKQLIDHYDPASSRLLSDYKNQNPQKNARKILQIQQVSPH